MQALLPLLIRREWRHHPWRHAVALLAVALGVALAYSVHLINGSALAEFSAAVRTANGDPDLVLRGPRDGFDDAFFDRVEADPGVQQASPVLEVDTYGRDATGRRVPVRVLGLDTLRAAPLAPGLIPRPAAGADRLVFLDPDAAFPNAAATRLLELADGARVELQSGTAYVALRVAGSTAAPGTPLVVMDLAGAQAHFGALGRLSRIDIRLVPGTDRALMLQRLALPPGVGAAAADDAEQRVSNLSRAYRVNLTVLALVALFVGAFLVFSVVSLSVAQRTPAFALLGVLGLTARQRRGWVLAECALLGAAGSLLGLLMGAGMAAAALRLLAGDLGGGYFPGIAPPLQAGPGRHRGLRPAGRGRGDGGRLVAGAPGRSPVAGTGAEGPGHARGPRAAGLAGLAAGGGRLGRRLRTAHPGPAAGRLRGRGRAAVRRRGAWCPRWCTRCWRPRRRPAALSRRSRTPAKAWSMLLNAPRMASASCWPASVRRTLRVVRRTSGRPAARSSSTTRWLIAALDSPSRCAAAVKLPASANTVSACR